MYDELIRSLRCCADNPCYECKFRGIYMDSCDGTLKTEAADAIEELTAYVQQTEKLRKDGYYLQKTKMMTYGQATMTMPLPQQPKEET